MKQLDPRTKIVILIAVSLAAMMTSKLIFLAGLLCFVMILMALMGVSLQNQKKQLCAAAGMVIFVFVIQALFGDWYLGLVLLVRLLIIIMSAEIIMTGQMRDYLLALIQWKIPYELAYMVVLAFHFFPLLKEEALDVYYSIQLRGTELKKTGLKNKMSAYRKICMPILAGALSRASDTAAAMEARGFRAYKKRTYMRRLKLKPVDFVVMIVIPILTAGFIWTAAFEDEKYITGYEVAISYVNDNQVSVSWSDDEKYKGVLECGNKSVKAKVSEITDGCYRYEAKVNVLPGKSYKYTVGSEKERSDEGRFELNEVSDDEELSFMVMGDVQYKIKERDYAIWGDFLNKAYENSNSPEFLIMVGDMVDKGADPQEWKLFFAAGEKVFSRIPLMTAVGNHESPGTPARYVQMLSLPENGPEKSEKFSFKEQIYSFDYGNCHFLSLNSCILMTENLGKPEYGGSIEHVNEWIAKDLKNSEAEWNIVYMHHPMYPVEEDDEIYERIRENWEDIFSKNGVDVVLCGHQHVYMRTDKIKGITHVMLRSGQKESHYYDEGDKFPEYIKTINRDNPNYMIVDSIKKKLRFRVYDDKEHLIDEWEIKHD